MKNYAIFRVTIDGVLDVRLIVDSKTMALEFYKRAGCDKENYLVVSYLNKMSFFDAFNSGCVEYIA
jgi:hypothetical protein